MTLAVGGTLNSNQPTNSCDVCFGTFALMTRVSISSISRYSFKIRRLEEQRQVITAAAIEKSGTADTMVGQKCGPALAGPAAPATTALYDVTLFALSLYR